MPPTAQDAGQDGRHPSLGYSSDSVLASPPVVQAQSMELTTTATAVWRNPLRRET
ncbi:unnamed protein product [Prunus armeniaca]|uniref:Uncharacterized protein n=1 Tax=Prunus armeniaca TaxID=36596 RepID=A0A6J5XNS4_PRUAR|nr:unnamed protein product [Prunus armeniaca]